VRFGEEEIGGSIELRQKIEKIEQMISELNVNEGISGSLVSECILVSIGQNFLIETLS
jgi:hypothetical protein